MTLTRLPIGIEELREIPALGELPDSDLRALAEVMVKRHFAPGQVIFLEGDHSRSLWFVFKGRVKIIKQSLNGRVQGLCLMDRGKCFGSCPLFSMDRNPATAEALDEVTLFVLSADDVEQLKARDPRLVKALIHIYSQRLQHLAKVSEVLGSWTVSDRINDCLLMYAKQAEDQQPAVDLTHERLAALSGTVREVVTRHLGMLEKHGVVRNENGRVVILNSNALLPPCACDDGVAPA